MGTKAPKVPQIRVMLIRPIVTGTKATWRARAFSGSRSASPCPVCCRVWLTASAPGMVKINSTVVTPMSVRRSIHFSARPAMAGPSVKPTCIESVSQPIARPSRPLDTDSVTALKIADCCAPAASPPTICHRNRGATLTVNAVAICERAVAPSDRPSRVRAPKRSTSTPEGSESSAAAIVATEKSAPTSNRLAPRSCAYRGTVTPRAAMVANTAPAATYRKSMRRDSGTAWVTLPNIPATWSASELATGAWPGASLSRGLWPACL